MKKQLRVIFSLVCSNRLFAIHGVILYSVDLMKNLGNSFSPCGPPSREITNRIGILIILTFAATAFTFNKYGRKCSNGGQDQTCNNTFLSTKSTKKFKFLATTIHRITEPVNRT